MKEWYVSRDTSRDIDSLNDANVSIMAIHKQVREVMKILSLRKSRQMIF
jgi:hypothetical protein